MFYKSKEAIVAAINKTIKKWFWVKPLVYSQTCPLLVLVISFHRIIVLPTQVCQGVVRLDGVLFWQALVSLDLQNHVMSN